MADRPTNDASQYVAATFVGRQHTVGHDQHPGLLQCFDRGQDQPRERLDRIDAAFFTANGTLSLLMGIAFLFAKMRGIG